MHYWLCHNGYNAIVKFSISNFFVYFLHGTNEMLHNFLFIKTFRTCFIEFVMTSTIDILFGSMQRLKKCVSFPTFFFNCYCKKEFVGWSKLLHSWKVWDFYTNVKFCSRWIYILYYDAAHNDINVMLFLCLNFPYWAHGIQAQVKVSFSAFLHCILLSCVETIEWISLMLV